MSPIPDGSLRIVAFALAASLGLAACAVDAGSPEESDTTTSPSSEASKAADASDAIAPETGAAKIASQGQEMLFQKWFYCRQVSYLVQIQYWYDLPYTGIIVGEIHADQYGPDTGIDYTVQIKTVHDDHHVWWSRTGTTAGPHLNFPASSTPATDYPLSWEPYVRLFLGADGDGLTNCNFDADLD